MQGNILINLGSAIKIPAEDAQKREDRVVWIAVSNLIGASIYVF